jgi:hypothetical protein
VAITVPLGFALRTISELNSDSVIVPPDDAALARAVVAAAESQQKFIGEHVGGDAGDFCAAVREVTEHTQTRLLLIQIVNRGRGMPFDPEVLASLASHGICSTDLHNLWLQPTTQNLRNEERTILSLWRSETASGRAAIAKLRRLEGKLP